MKKHAKLASVILMACMLVLAFPMNAAAARPAPPPAAISITANPAGPIQATVGTTTTIILTSTYSNPLTWSAAATVGTAEIKPATTELSGGLHTTTLTASATAVGTGKITVTATDSKNRKIKATLTLSITYVGSINHAPVFDSSAYSITTPEDTAGSLAVSATDPDQGDILIYSVTNPAHGIVSWTNTTNTYTYTPAKDYSGTDSFTVTASDGKSSTQTTVGVTVTPVNDAPVAAADTAAGKVNATIRILPLANDTDVDTASGSLAILSYTPASGLSIVQGSGYFDVTAGTAGVYTFQYSISDGLAESNLASVTVTISGDLVYVALGDSIPDGYYYTSLWNYLAGGTNSYSYIKQFRDTLGILPANYYDESISGLNSVDVRNQLADAAVQAAIVKADVITLCVGANDIMDAAPRTVSGLDKGKVDWVLADQGRDAFETNWIAIIDGIETLNPDVTLIVMTVYNPYRTSDTVYATADAYFEATAAGDYGLNYIIRNTETLYDAQLADDFDYRVADVYSAFNASANKDSLTGFYSSFCDPHPNQAGQNLIFSTHLDEYNQGIH